MKLTEREEARVKELKQIGFEVVGQALLTVPQQPTTQVCYWRYMRGNRVSALHPFEEAAWRDAIREWDTVSRKVADNPGIHRGPNKKLGEEVLEALLVRRGFTIKEYSWSRGGGTFGGFSSRSETLKDATAYWSQHNTADFLDAILMATDEAKLDELMKGKNTKFSPSELNILQGFKSQGMTWDQLTSKSQYLVDLMAKSGLTIDVRKAKETYLSLSTDPLPIDAMKRTLENAGYTFQFSAVKGWYCAGVEGASGSLETAVKRTWRHALNTGKSEVDMVSICRGYYEPGAVTEEFLKAQTAECVECRGDKEPVNEHKVCATCVETFPRWDGTGQPPPGTTLWITPHNTLWGFVVVGTYLCQVLAYRDEYVWLELLTDKGENTYKFTTTRIDKVDAYVWKGNNHA